MAFTGDCLLIRSADRTDFQAGDIETEQHEDKMLYQTDA